MNTENIIAYLQDHLAGSVAALELLERLASSTNGTDLSTQIVDLKIEVEADQTVLKNLLVRLGADENPTKKAGGWIAEKALNLKTKLSDGDLGLLEAFEVLALGIEGKRKLWRALACVDLGQDLPHLEASALRQGERVESLRLQTAHRAFAA